MRTGDFVQPPGLTANAHLVAFHEEMSGNFTTDAQLNDCLNERVISLYSAMEQVWFPDVAMDNETSSSIFRSIKTLLWDYTDPTDYDDQHARLDMGLLLSTLFQAADHQATDFAALLEDYTYRSHVALNRLTRVLTRLAAQGKPSNTQRFLAVYGMVLGAIPDVPPQSRGTSAIQT